MTTRDDVHDRPAPSGPDSSGSTTTGPAGPAAVDGRSGRGDPARRSGADDPVAVLRRLAAGRAGDGMHEPEAGGGPLRAWEAVRAGRWSTTPLAALGVGLVALLVCAVVLVRAHLLAPDPAATDAGQRVAIAAAADDAADGAVVDPLGEGASAAAGADSTAPASTDPASTDPASTDPASTDPADALPAAAGAGPAGAVGPGTGGTAAALPALVHVVGQVRAPGVVEVAAGARVADAVAAAGGFTTEADPSALNLARAVVDGEQVVVPRPGEVPVVAPAPAAGPAPAGGGTAGAGADASPGASGGLVPLDTATAAELDALPGIGPVLAQRIVEWREAHGGFTSTDELGEVSGIGDKVLEQLRPLVAA